MEKSKLKRIIIGAVLFWAAFLTEKLADTPLIWGIDLIPLIIYVLAYLTVGIDVIINAAKNIARGKVFDENFLMLVASIGAFIIGEYSESVVVMLFYQVGEYFQSYAVGKSRKSIADLMDIKPNKATKIVDGVEIAVMPEDIAVDDLLIVKNGEKIPVDGIVEEGETHIDTKALTGESAPRFSSKGDAVLSGSINIGGVITVRAKKEYFDSTVSKILDLVENVAGKKAQSENFITKFAAVYTPIVCGLAVLLAVIPSLIAGEWSVWVFRALTFLVVSCPCALVISVPLSYFGGIGGASKYGILVKGGNYLEALTKLDTVVFDKTGTLTKGNFKVSAVYPESDKNLILSKAAIAEKGSNHPIALSVLAEYASEPESGYEINEIAGKGISAKRGDKEILVGNAKLMTERKIDYIASSDYGTTLYVAENGKFLGTIVIRDEIKENAKEAIESLKSLGLKTIMLTGDNKQIAEGVASQIGLDAYKADLLPMDKVNELEKIMKDGGVTAFVGDGINDAPVLTRANVGISMGGIGSDSAIEASDVVLMRDDLTKIATARRIANKTHRIVMENIWFALIVKVAVLVLSALGFVNMWIAVFADVGVSVLAIINAMRCMKNKEKA